MSKSMCPSVFVLLFTVTAGFLNPSHAQDLDLASRKSRSMRYFQMSQLIGRPGISEPTLMPDNERLWYASGMPESTLIYVVDPHSNTETQLFDVERLRQSLRAVLDHEPPHSALPFTEFDFVDGREDIVAFDVENRRYILNINDYTVEPASAQFIEKEKRRQPRVVRSGLFGDFQPIREMPSPDQDRFAGIRDGNLWIRSAIDTTSVQITTEGFDDFGWDVEDAKWAPDSRRLAIKKIDQRNVPKFPIVHWTKPGEPVEWQRYSRVGQAIPHPELYVIDTRVKKQVRIDLGDGGQPYIHVVRWHPDGSEIYILRMNRMMNRLDLLAADPASGSTRTILTETSETFIVGLAFLHGYTSRLEKSNHVVFLKDSGRFIWTSERSGWRHLYLYDLDGSLIRPLTSGRFEVRQLEAIDELNDWVYYSARGDTERPYDVQLYRTPLGGGKPELIVEGPVIAEIGFTRSRDFIWIQRAGFDQPPVIELRKADGTLLRTLWGADTQPLDDLAWKPPEEFIAKSVDGKTDLRGFIIKPSDFDPEQKYPVVEAIYAGPQVSLAPAMSEWWLWYSHSIAELGFIVYIMDGRGTPGRGKAFQDVVHGNFGRHEIPDHIAFLKQLASDRPYMDLDRVGIVGHSWGGYFVLRALLLAPEVFHVGVASAPAVDLADFRVSIEPYLGRLPETSPEIYEYGSNTRLADKLEGKLLLIHGTSDNDVPFAGTMMLIDALIRANKAYDLIVVPEGSHSSILNGYWMEAMYGYFLEHLQP